MRHQSLTVQAFISRQWVSLPPTFASQYITYIFKRVLCTAHNLYLIIWRTVGPYGFYNGLAH